jgi:prepilin-type N-terminal cleavage/methylation domain-containing protein
MSWTSRFSVPDVASRTRRATQYAIRNTQQNRQRDTQAARRSFPVSRFPYSGFRFSAFTLLEIMIVVGIIGVVMTMGVPLVYKAWHKAPMTKAVSGIVEVCSHARALAIMQGREVDVIFHPREGRLEVGASPVVAAPHPGSPTPAVSAPPTLSVAPSGAGLSTRLPEKVLIELMDINKLPHEFRDDDVARVRFFPNGTCDELTLVLVSDQNERREITLEVTTALANVESNPTRFR